VALDGVTEGWVTVEVKVALPPPPRRAAREIRLLHQGDDLLLRRGCLISSPSSWPISSPSPSARVPPSGPPSSAASSCSSKLPLLERRPLSLPPLISVFVHCARCRVPWHAPRAHGARPNLEGHVGVHDNSGLKRQQRWLRSQARRRW
jgi:hypothetical protein